MIHEQFLQGRIPWLLHMGRLNSGCMFKFDFDALVNVYQVFHPFEQ